MSDARLPRHLRRRAGSPRCTCGHPNGDHSLDRNGRVICGTVCGCSEFVAAQPTPARFRDDWADELEPARRHDMGAHQPSEWPEAYEVAE